MRRARWMLVGAAATSLLVAAQRIDAGGGVVAPEAARVDPACPTGAERVVAGTPLQAAIDSAPPGAVLCLGPGRYRGPLLISRRLTVLGTRDAVVTAADTGTTIRILADSVTLGGFSVEGSGRRYDRMDAAVYLRGRGITVRGLTVRRALFGIVVERSDSVTVADNRVTGLAELPVGMRGDGIRMWEVRRSRITGNQLLDSRDILIWYSPGNVIDGNTVARSRYGTHFMYSDDCLLQNAEYRANIVGVFVMYSRGVTLRHNLIADNVSGDGLGVGAKESGNLVLDDNRFIHDQSCIYLDTSPFRETDSVLVRRNAFVRCTAGVTFHSSERRNAFLDNVFEGNQTQVAVEGRGTAQGVAWRGNFFDDYQGYDLDGNGIGDVPYEVRSLSERLVASHPQLAFFRGTVALGLLDLAGRALPLLQPETLLVDSTPRVVPPAGLTATRSAGGWQ